jgi:hypothetical protein
VLGRLYSAICALEGKLHFQNVVARLLNTNAKYQRSEYSQ